MESTTHDIKDDADYDQQCPNHHDVLDVEFAGVHPAPDQSPYAAGDDSNNAVHHTAVLKLLDQNYDEADQTTKTE
jgi:hypothetical protein